MRRKSVAAGAVTLVLAFAVVASALSQDDELRVTMRVLDDVSEIEGVLLPLERELDGEASDDAAARGEQSADQPQPAAERVQSAGDDSAPAEPDGAR